MKHKIDWLNVPGYVPQTWNPIIGCSKISAGCQNCYAEKMAFRLAMMFNGNYEQVVDPLTDKWNGKTRLVESTLKKPLSMKKPRAFFMSMTDPFHERILIHWIDMVFAVAALCPQHLFILLTKRAEKMQAYFNHIDKAISLGVGFRMDRLTGNGEISSPRRRPEIPLKNVWLGVTAENQEMADARIPLLMETPAARRFVSCEPMLGEINLNRVALFQDGSGVDWVICGGESGSGARPMNPDWARSLRDQCKAANVPFFMKQMSGVNKADREAIPDDLLIKEWPEVIADFRKHGQA
ncbi:MAG: phage Gp37/Gp68 family protein [Kiritimatiellales bacterium]